MTKWKCLAIIHSTTLGEKQTYTAQTLHTKCQHGGGGMMIWAWFSVTGPGHPAITESTMHFSIYQRILEQNVRPSVWQLTLSPKWVTQHVQRQIYNLQLVCTQFFIWLCVISCTKCISKLVSSFSTSPPSQITLCKLFLQSVATRLSYSVELKKTKTFESRVSVGCLYVEYYSRCCLSVCLTSLTWAFPVSKNCRQSHHHLAHYYRMT